MPSPTDSAKAFADYLAHSWPVGEVRSTKELAQALGVTTPRAYCLLADACDAGHVSRYGYRVAPGVWESPEHSTLRPASLHWQRDEPPATH